MRSPFWFDVVLGGILVLSLYVKRLAEDPRPLYGGAVMGSLLLAWALMESHSLGVQVSALEEGSRRR